MEDEWKSSPTALAPRLLDEHAVPVRIEPVFLFDGVAIGGQHALFAAEGTNQHQQRGLRQMKIGEQRANHPELKSGIDEQIGIAAPGLHSSVLAGGILQGS